MPYDAQSQARANAHAESADEQIAKAARGPGCVAQAFAWVTNVALGVIILVAFFGFLAIVFAPAWVQMVFHFPGG